MPLPRTPNEGRQALIGFGPYSHAQVVNTDTTDKLFKVLPGKKFRLDRVDYVNPTGLAANASNFANIKITKGATVMANWSTETGQQGTLTGDTFVAFTLSATEADRVAAEGDEIRVFFDMTGTVTLPAGRITLHGRYV